MPANFQLILDTTGPQGVAGQIDAGAAFTADRVVDLAATTTDPDTTGYQIKVWGADVDPAANPNIQATEAASSWITLAPTVAVTLAGGDGAKTLNFKLRDDVWNESAPATASITLDETAPTITVTGPDVAKVSKVTGKDLAHFSFSSNQALQAWTVRVVPDASSPHTAGTEIPVTNGSVGMSGGALAAAAVENCTIDGADLELASAGDGAKVVKVFGQDTSGLWSN